MEPRGEPGEEPPAVHGPLTPPAAQQQPSPRRSHARRESAVTAWSDSPKNRLHPSADATHFLVPGPPPTTNRGTTTPPSVLPTIPLGPRPASAGKPIIPPDHEATLANRRRTPPAVVLHQEIVLDPVVRVVPIISPQLSSDADGSSRSRTGGPPTAPRTVSGGSPRRRGPRMGTTLQRRRAPGEGGNGARDSPEPAFPDVPRTLVRD